MKIVLIRPNYETFIYSPALGLGYLSSVIKESGSESLIIDALRDNLKHNDILQILNEYSPDIVGITCLSAYYPETTALSKFIKKNNYKVFIGGVHPTFLPYTTLKDSDADLVICGEGEMALKQLIANNLDYSNIQGIYSLSDLKSDNDKYLFAEVINNLDDIPMPDWEQLKIHKLPNAPHGGLSKGFPIGTVMTSRGCAFHCSFCSSPSFYGQRVRFRSIDKILDEIEYLKENYNIKELQIIDDNLAANKSYVLEFCAKYILRKINIPWSCPNGLRADCINDEISSALKKAGCYFTAVGIESGDEKILIDINKRESLDDIEKGINSLKKNGIIVQGNFIIGFPNETKESLKNTIEYIFKLNLDRLNIEMLELLPGSNLYSELRGQFTPNFSIKSSKILTYIPSRITKEELNGKIGQILRRFYLRPKIFFRILFSIRFNQLMNILKRLLLYGFFR